MAVQEFVRKMDALLELLAAIADALAAEWDLRSEPGTTGMAGSSRLFTKTE